MDKDSCMNDLATVLESLNIQPMSGPVSAHKYTEHRVLHEPSVDIEEDEDFEGFEYTVEVGDTVEVDISGAESTDRMTYIVDPDKDDLAMGIVRGWTRRADRKLGCR